MAGRVVCHPLGPQGHSEQAQHPLSRHLLSGFHQTGSPGSEGLAPWWRLVD